MSCDQLAGAYEATFRANSFDEMAALSKAYALEMQAKGDKGHFHAMGKMQKLMKSPQKINLWFKLKQHEFDNVPESQWPAR
jgi:hypothetical protein